MGSLEKDDQAEGIDHRVSLAVPEDCTDIDDISESDCPQHDHRMFNSPFLDMAMNVAPTTEEDEPAVTYESRKGLHRYHSTLRSLLPRQIPDRERDVLPLDHVGFCNTLAFSWMTGLLWGVFRHGIATMKNYRCTLAESCSLNTQRLEYLWQEELQCQGPEKSSLARVVSRFLRTRVGVTIFLFTLGLTLAFLTPVIFLYELLEFVKDPDAPLIDGLLWLLAILFVDVIKMFIFSLHWAINVRTSLRIRTAILGLVFGKLVRLNSLGDKSVGEIINLFANDSVRILEYAALGHLWVGATVVIVISLVYVFWELGILAFASLGVFVFSYAQIFLVSKLVGHYRRKAVKISDQRVRQMTEILNCMKIIKLYAWEESFIKTTTVIRNRERGFLEKMVLLQSLGQSFSIAVPVIAAIITFITCFLLGHPMNAAQAFAILGALTMTRSGLVLLPVTAGKIAEFQSSVKRMQSVLLMDNVVANLSKPLDPAHAIVFTNASFAWNAPIECSSSTIDLQNRKTCRNAVKVCSNTFSDQKSKAECPLSTEHMHSTRSTVEYENGDMQGRRMTKNDGQSIVPTLHDIDLVITKGKLIGICGTVGSGKSSLISAVLGQEVTALQQHCVSKKHVEMESISQTVLHSSKEMHLTNGELAVDGSHAYVAQQAWIMNDTVKNNVVFGDSNFDAKRLQAAIECCGLAEDVDSLPGGLNAEIGERGVNLSGGQKQRVSLARAVYSNCDIYLLDDPLSAVDYRVGAQIFRECIRGPLATRTVLFVSHQIRYLEKCDYVVVMKDGRVTEQGIPGELQKSGGAYAALYHQQQEDEKEHSNRCRRTDSYGDGNRYIPGAPKSGDAHDMSNKDAGIRITNEEPLEHGAIQMDTYMSYIRAMGGIPVAVIIVLAIGINFLTTVASNWWLSVMLSRQPTSVTDTDFSTNKTLGVDGTVAKETTVPYAHDDLYIYGGIFLAIVFTCVLRAFTYVKGTLRASTVLHKDVLSSVIRSPMRFFETVPVGRTINVFSKDLDEVDIALTTVMETFIALTWANITSLLLVCFVFPWFLIPLLIILALFAFFTAIFQAGLRDIKRFENASRSPLFGHINAMVQGLATIHAYGKEKNFVERFLKLQDENTTLQILLQYTARWVAIRLDLLVVFIVLVNAVFIVFSRGLVTAAFAGLALSYTSQLGGMLHFLVRNVAETQARFTNVERIVRHIKRLTPEGYGIVPTITPQTDWPQEGHIVFNEVELRYREELSPALHHMSFSIRPMEKVGIVGRTGSGKSSLGVALFRLVELSKGTITVDGVDIARVELQMLRSRFSLIPQDPVLFIGTVRYNVDPFRQYTDEEIWEVLERTRLKAKITSLDKQLYAPVIENGENFSVGERQLMCLARALLRKSKIILLDEATASVDARTDALVQDILQDAFSECTILTIAHRVHTVLNYDRILIIKDGTVQNFDNPQRLMDDPNSYLSVLLKESLDKGKPQPP